MLLLLLLLLLSSMHEYPPKSLYSQHSHMRWDTQQNHTVCMKVQMLVCCCFGWVFRLFLLLFLLLPFFFLGGGVRPCVCVYVCVCVCVVFCCLSVPGGLGCPAQMSPLQRRNSSGMPMQESPPVGKGESQRRSLFCLPAPHAAEHAVQSVHCDQPPAAAQWDRRR